MFMQSTRIVNLHGLNTALMRLQPSISGISLSMLEKKGASLAMLDQVIVEDQTSLFNGMKRAAIITALKPAHTS